MSLIAKRLIKAAGKEILENDKSMSCYEKAVGKFFGNPLESLGDMGKCFIGGAIEKRVKRR